MNTNGIDYCICPRCGNDKIEVNWEPSVNCFGNIDTECIPDYWCERCNLLYLEDEYLEYIEEYRNECGNKRHKKQLVNNNSNELLPCPFCGSVKTNPLEHNANCYYRMFYEMMLPNSETIYPEEALREACNSRI